MKTKKKKSLWVILTSLIMLVCCCFVFYGCNNDTTANSNSGGQQNPPDNLGGGQTGKLPSEVDYLDKETTILTTMSNLGLESFKQNTTYDSENITQVASDGIISGAGNYLLSGDYPNGITITANKDDEIHLFLNGANISSTSLSGIAKTDKAITLYITAMSGTENTITSSSSSTNALQVKGTLIINGTGNLSVIANGEDSSGIKVSKTCYIVNANVSIKSNKHGISAQTICAEDSTINITALSENSKDGLHSECDFDNKKGTTYEFSNDSGYVYLKNVNYTCKVYGDGIQADTYVYIEGGQTNITAQGIFVQYSEQNKTTYSLTNDDFRFTKNGTAYIKVASDENRSISSLYALVQSAKGIKVGEIEYDTDGDDIDDSVVLSSDYSIYIKSGEFTINSSDDAIHSNSGNTFIKGGNFTINTNDDAITSDLLTQIDGGEIDIQSSYEGLEGAYVKISGGNLSIVSSDDGINSASDDENITEYIVITGGEILVNASGDGLDSNGSILISGGNVTVIGPTSGGDGALDSETGIIVEGGTLIAYSSLGMVETPSTNSTQCVVSYGQNSQIASNTTITLKDSDNSEIVSFVTQKASGSIIISSPLLSNGKTYSLYVGNSKVSTFTISSILTTLGTSSNFSGGGNMGGGQQPGGNPPQRPN